MKVLRPVRYGVLPLSRGVVRVQCHRVIDRKWYESVHSRVSNEIKHRGTNICLEESHLDLKTKHKGKVRDIYDLGDVVLFVTTDRLSAFDRSLFSCPFKGQVLNQCCAWWFDKTQNAVPNAVIDVPDPNIMIMKKTKVFPVEFVVRAYMTGTTSTSLWTNYNQGVRKYCGHHLPDGLHRNEILEQPIITPTTKSDKHDELISAEQIIQQQYMTQDDWEEASSLALKLFKIGQEIALERDLILVDTKYEFGKDEKGNILLIDEVHTPDSSRFWIHSTYHEKLSRGENPENFDKEFVRQWYASCCDPYHDQELPSPPEDLISTLASRYVFLYEAMMGLEFDMGNFQKESEINNRMCQNIKKRLRYNSMLKTSIRGQ